MTPSPSPTSLAASFSFFLRFFASFALSNRVHVTTCAYVRLLRGSLALCFFPARSLSGRAEMKTFWRFRLCEATFCSQARGDVRGEGRTARLSLLPLFFHLLQRSLLFFFARFLFASFTSFRLSLWFAANGRSELLFRSLTTLTTLSFPSFYRFAQVEEEPAAFVCVERERDGTLTCCVFNRR